MENLIQNIRIQKHNNIPKLVISLGFKDVTFSYNDSQIVFKNANFNVSSNGLVLFKGSNGCGKTTLIKLLTNFKPSQGGEIICNVDSVIGYSSANGNDINPYIECDSFLFDCLDNMESKYFSSVLDFLHLQQCKNHRIVELSSGQRKKLSIFRAFVKSQYCMFFDEPLSFLDVDFQKVVLEQIYELRKQMTILIVTHTNKFDEMADFIYEIKNKNINLLKS